MQILAWRELQAIKKVYSIIWNSQTELSFKDNLKINVDQHTRGNKHHRENQLRCPELLCRISYFQVVADVRFSNVDKFSNVFKSSNGRP